jgi:thioredoxin reductase (NADPH)
LESQVCKGDEIVFVGGGNSAGQAAVFLADSARKVNLLVRSEGLAKSMSRYLIRRIEDNPKIVLKTFTEIIALEGKSHLESVRWKNNKTEEIEHHHIRNVFIMSGAIPNTNWLEGCISLDSKGFIKTGANLLPEDLRQSRWPLSRHPYLLETNLPGIFAVGDVRDGSIKRVASAVGEGSIAISFVHQVLNE